VANNDSTNWKIFDLVANRNTIKHEETHRGAMETSLIGLSWTIAVLRQTVVNAYRRDREQQSTEYSNKKRSSGHVGLAWGGLVAGGVAQLNVKGRLDHEKKAKLIQANNRSK